MRRFFCDIHDGEAFTPDRVGLDLSRFQRGGQRMLDVIPSRGLVRDADHGRQIPGCRERRAAA